MAGKGGTAQPGLGGNLLRADEAVFGERELSHRLSCLPQNCAGVGDLSNELGTVSLGVYARDRTSPGAYLGLGQLRVFLSICSGRAAD